MCSCVGVGSGTDLRLPLPVELRNDTAEQMRSRMSSSYLGMSEAGMDSLFGNSSVEEGARAMRFKPPFAEIYPRVNEVVTYSRPG